MEDGCIPASGEASIPTEQTDGPVVASHTPGPWTAFDTYIGVGVQAKWDVAHCSGLNAAASRTEVVANARLMAAAPDLLAAAVAMVKGEDDLIAELIAEGDDPKKYGMPFPLVDALRAAIRKATTPAETGSVGMEPQSGGMRP